MKKPDADGLPWAPWCLAVAVTGALAACGGGAEFGEGATVNGQPLQGTYSTGDFANFVTFFSDGSYVFGSHGNDAGCGSSSGNGAEVGTYNWNPTTGKFTAIGGGVDTNGGCGFVDGASPVTGSLTSNSGTLNVVLMSGARFLLTPVPSTVNSLIGSFQVGSVGTMPASATPEVITFVGNDNYFLTSTDSASGAVAGVEDGCYSVDPNNVFSVDLSSNCAAASGGGAIDTNAGGGFSSDSSEAMLTVTGDTLQFQDSSRNFTAKRIPVRKPPDPPDPSPG